jgi:hypothetical protein
VCWALIAGKYGVMFSWLKGKSGEPTRGELFARTFDLSLSDMLEMLTSRMAGEAPADRAMVLVAFANTRSELKAGKSINKSHASQLPTTYSNHGRMVARLFDKYPPTQQGELDVPNAAEIKFRRLFHFFRASVLGAISERAHETNGELQTVADVWGEHIASAGHLTSIVKHTRIWSRDELEWFAGDFDEELQIRNVLYTVVPGFLWQHDEMLKMAKDRFHVFASLLKSRSAEIV